MSTANVDGYPRDVWWNADGETVVESYTITDMAHGTPLGLAEGNDESYGAAGAFLIEAGISSSYHIANFFGLTERVSQPNEAGPRREVRRQAGAEAGDAGHSVGRHRGAEVTGPRRHAVAADGDRSSGHPAANAEAHRHRRRRVITRALTAAGLMK